MRTTPLVVGAGVLSFLTVLVAVTVRAPETPVRATAQIAYDPAPGRLADLEARLLELADPEPAPAPLPLAERIACLGSVQEGLLESGDRVGLREDPALEVP